MNEARTINVLVVDDSAVVRQTATAILGQAPEVSVAVAADPLIAREKMKRLRPDVILLDIEMPRMDGLTFLRQLMAEDPIPVVICSALTGSGTATALRALEEGAVDVITKPRLGVQAFLEDSAARLLDTVRAAAAARVSLLKPRARRQTGDLPPRPRLTADAVLRRKSSTVTAGGPSLIAAGASTGGTEALHELLHEMPVDAPGIVIVQHMPEPFARAFAERLDQMSPIRVKQAAHGDRVVPGQALVAPGDRHLLVRRNGPDYVAELSDGPPVSRHRPSVDVLFRSVAQAAGASAVGILMTGMGDDGAVGLLEMRQAGAFTLAQDEATSVVFGMPREAIRRGAADAVLPLSALAAAALARTRGSS